MNTWIEWANGVSGRWAELMVRASWQGGLALLAAWGMCVLIARLAGGASGAARPQCWFWRLAHGKFVLCLLWLAPLALPLLPAPRVDPPPARVVAMAPQPAMATDQAPLAVPETTAEPTVATVAPVAPPPVPVASPTARVRIESWLLGLWSVGVVVCLGKLLMAWRRTRLLRSVARPAEESVQMACVRLAHAMGLTRAPAVMAAAIDSPVLVGLWRPVIILPQRLDADDGAASLRLVLAHELAHLKRRDLAWNWLRTVVEAVFFFHPLVWVTRRSWRLAAEMACDEQALRVTGARAVDYGRMLVDMVAHPRAARAGLIGVGVAESAGTLGWRLQAMKTTRRWSRGRLAGAATAATLVGVLGLVPWRVVAQQATTPQPAVVPGAAQAVLVPAAPGVMPPVVPQEVREGAVGATAQVEPAQLRMIDQDGKPASIQGVMVPAQPYTVPGMPAGAMVPAQAVPVPGVAGGGMMPAQPVPAQPTKDAELFGVTLNGIPAPPVPVTATPGAPGASIPPEQNVEARMQAARMAAIGEQPPAALEPGEFQLDKNVYNGVISATIADIRAPLDGTIAEVAVKAGQQVKKGDLLLRFDARKEELEIELNKARLAIAQTQLISDKDAGKMGQLGMDEVQVNAQKTILDASMRNLETTRVVAPFDGVLSTCDVTPGQFVSRGTALTQVVMTNQLRVDFRVQEGVLSHLRVGQKIKFQASAATGGDIDGEITYIAPVVDTTILKLRDEHGVTHDMTEHGIAIRGVITGNSEHLRPGMMAFVRIMGH